MTSSRPAPGIPEGGLFPSRGSRGEALRIGALLRKETVGGALLVVMAAIGIVWANSPWADSYFALRDLEVGYEPWHLNLTLGAWASDGLLAIFFFLVGLELKREFVAGDLRRIGTAIVPVVAAAGGVIVPAVIYAAIVHPHTQLLRGWAIPTATDIAFAVAVLALIGSHLPGPLRIFLLTLAVVDDLIAITIIAVFYTETIVVVPLLLGLLAIVGYGILAQRYRQFFHLKPAAAWLILLPIGVVAWAFIHASGIHATIAGVLLGFTIPVLHRRRDRVPDAEPGLAEVFEHRFRPLSAGVAVPLFALLSAGVALGGIDGLASALADPVTIGIVLALVAGKPIGILLATWLTTRARGIRLDPALHWIDIVGVGLLAGIGFTVSLLVTELSFDAADAHHDHAKVAILLASLIAAAVASVLLTSRNRRYRRIAVQDAAALSDQ
ncbi:Na+/H+ antiporter NhaA [Microbacterium sp.]|uniref:Na+/H+ antiporter NhaA n=1 Tax=Microbacterium sp. TaxID=51671 RepID=UPI0039E390BF